MNDGKDGQLLTEIPRGNSVKSAYRNHNHRRKGIIQLSIDNIKRGKWRSGKCDAQKCVKSNRRFKIGDLIFRHTMRGHNRNYHVECWERMFID